MTHTPSRSRQAGHISWLLLCVVAYAFLSLNAAAQENGKNPSAHATSSSQPEVHQLENGSQRPHFGRDLAKESREAAGEDQTAQFKHSAMVQRLARITGLSLQHAYWLSMVVNFAIIASFIMWSAKKYLPGIFRNRTAHIQKAMEDARRASQEANRRLAGIEARLAHLDAEIAGLRASAEKEAAAEEARIQAAAEEDARKIVRLAEEEIAAAAKAVRRELTAWAASMAVSLAAKQIRVDRASDEALVQGFAGKLVTDGKPRKGGQ